MHVSCWQVSLAGTTDVVAARPGPGLPVAGVYDVGRGERDDSPAARALAWQGPPGVGRVG